MSSIADTNRSGVDRPSVQTDDAVVRLFVTDFLPRPSGTTPVGEAQTQPLGTRERCFDALLVLNYHLPDFVPYLWRNSQLRYCADGGANRLWDALPRLFPDEDPGKVRARFVPDAIVGDLDSIRPEVLSYYTSHGAVTFDLSHDQDTTDLHKSIKAMIAAEMRNAYGRTAGFERTWLGTHRIFVVGALGGRLDHELSNMSTVHEFPDTNIVLIGRSSLAMLIPPGKTVLIPDLTCEGPTCGLVPLAGPARVTTTGLRWNLTDEVIAFGQFISTSNRILEVRSGAAEVTIATDAPLVWTTDIGTLTRRGP